MALAQAVVVALTSAVGALRRKPAMFGYTDSMPPVCSAPPVNKSPSLKDLQGGLSIPKQLYTGLLLDSVGLGQDADLIQTRCARE